MVERTPHRPIPGGELKQNAPEAGAGPLGIPPPTSEHSPQGGGSTNPERQQLPSALDLLERLAQHDEDRETATARLGRYMTRARRAWDVESRDRGSELNKELHAVRALGTDYDRFILDVYTTLSKPSPTLGLVRGRALMAKETKRILSVVRGYTLSLAGSMSRVA
jgi:hypothetical protein